MFTPFEANQTVSLIIQSGKSNGRTIIVHEFPICHVSFQEKMANIITTEEAQLFNQLDNVIDNRSGN